MDITPVDNVILLVGMRNSGKTEILKSIVNSHRDEFDKIIALCPTPNNTYDDLIGEENVSKEYTDKRVGDIFQRMEKVNKGKTKKDKDFKHILVILDDCVINIKHGKQESLETIVVRGRHVGIALLFTTQYIKVGAPPVVRNNCDYVFIGTCNGQSKNIIYDEFKKKRKNDELEELLEDAGVDYRFLVIKCCSRSKGESRYAWIKSDEVY